MYFGIRSDKGKIRGDNEDNYTAFELLENKCAFFAIADGMGGHNAGGLASKIAINYVSQYIMQRSYDISNNISLLPIDILKNAIFIANNAIIEESFKEISYQGMGTTLTAAIIRNNIIFIGHVGDSRIYKISNHCLTQLTIDHSYVEELIKMGSVSREEARNHPQKNVITRALGFAENLEIDTFSYNINPNDTFLMCTDGLTNMVNEQEILKITDSSESPQVICDKLVECANQNGGKDNITVILFKGIY